jgi:hypothetical protein
MNTAIENESKFWERVSAGIKQLPEIEPSPNFNATVMGKLKETKKPGWLSMIAPAYVYSTIFIVFLALGFSINVNLETRNANATAINEKIQPEIVVSMTQILNESQDLRLINVQEQAIELLREANGKGGSHEQEMD